MKKIRVLSCCVCVVFAVLLSFGSSVLCYAQGSEGASFSQNCLNRTDRSFSDVPLTFEAWVSVPKSQSGRAGVIIGNYASSANQPCINFEIHKNGKPRLYIIDTNKTSHDYTFSADVRTGSYAHVAVVLDPAADAVRCYINGKLAATKDGCFIPERETIERLYILGGDMRADNSQYFKGQIRSVRLFSETRSASQIQSDMNDTAPSGEGLIACFENGSAGFEDVSKNGYKVNSVKTWFSDKEPVKDYAYSFCVVGDTQKITYNEPDKLSCIYDWIIKNKEEKKIAFVFGLGDITDKSTDAEWLCAQKQISKLDGVVPYSLVRGNHDVSSNFNKYLGTAAYKQSCTGLYTPSKIENTYHEFTVGGVKYLNITLDYGASDALLTWASRIISEHPEHRVIITTHAYLFRDGTTLDANDVYPPNTTGVDDGIKNNGDMMWDKLISKHENIFLVLSGHDPCSDIIVTQTEGIHGNVVTQMLIDPQSVDQLQGATGMVAMLYFSEDGEHIMVENYSTVREQYFMSTSQLTLKVPKYDSDIEAEQTKGASESESVTSAADSDKDTVASDLRIGRFSISEFVTISVCF